jgi:hypothetical protein
VAFNGGGRPIPAVTGGEGSGEWVLERVGNAGIRFGVHWAKKLIGVWSSTVAHSGEGEPPVVALSSEQGGRLTSRGGAPRRCDARGLSARSIRGRGRPVMGRSPRRRNGAAQRFGPWVQHRSTETLGRARSFSEGCGSATA